MQNALCFKTSQMPKSLADPIQMLRGKLASTSRCEIPRNNVYFDINAMEKHDTSKMALLKGTNCSQSEKK